MKPLPQYLRGIAAVLVVLYHANLHLIKVYHIDALSSISRNGGGLAFLGVNMFFALSGYLMSSLVRTSSIGAFLWHRIARIYPAFLVAVGICYVASWMFSGKFPQMYWPALTLFPSRGYGPLEVEWSLVYEMAFYLMSAVFCLQRTRRFHLHFLGAWASVILLNNHVFHAIANTPPLPRFYEIPFSDYSLSFVLGGLGFYLMKIARVLSLVRGCGPYALAASVVWALYGVGVEGVPRYTVPVLCAASVAYAFNAEFAWRSSFLMRLGNRSYGIYLIHQMICTFVINLCATNVSVWWVMYGLMVVFAVHAGCLLGDLDVAIYRRLKNLSFGQARRRVPDGSPA